MNIGRRTVLGGAAAALAACAEFPRSPAAASALAREVKVIVFPGGFNWPLWVASAKGFFAGQGLSVQLTPTPNSTFQLTGLIRGEYDIAMTAIDNIIAYREGQGAPGADGSDLVAVMGGDNGFLKLAARPEIQRIQDLRGQTLSVDALTTGYAFVLLEILERNGLVLDRDYKTAPAGGVMQRYEQLLAGKHSATMLISPFDLMAQAQGLRVLTDASSALGSYQGLVAGTRSRWAQQNPRVVSGYIRAYKQALDWLYDPTNKQEAIELFVRNVPNSTPQSANVSHGLLLHPTTGFERRAQLSESGTRTVIALREKYGRPARKLQAPSTYYDARYYELAST